MANAQQRTDLDIEHFHARLLEEKALAEQTIAGTKSAEDPDGMNETGTDRSEITGADENHPADAGTDLFLREADMALVGNAGAILDKIDRALAKIAEGTYGLSDLSGEPIPIERLEAVPYATVTTEEQAREEVV